MVARAEQTGSMELNAKFSLQFVCVRVEERHRKYLVEGYLPTIEEMRTCLRCNHEFTDEPNSNRIATASNLQKIAGHEAQLATDRAVEANSSVVMTSRGNPMQVGRKRSEPKYNSLILNCHCGQFGCSTNEEPVPPQECPIGCIDDKTG